ncbi:uncharacterized protein LOC132036264 isoform X2 [Lycium ferocissimum]|uniref:uncharacterized protein LOC132036264 isoform X2 n=1 Tax=Lycium ferocissimum TaxID=112874 RepID=UPI002814CFE7|nr:uncharacterized protein LOC132036264 isoform X2 [Lycium ferocissimum]
MLKPKIKWMTSVNKAGLGTVETVIFTLHFHSLSLCSAPSRYPSTLEASISYIFTMAPATADAIEPRVESLLGFIEPPADDTVEGNSLSLKLVPWISWDEWNSIRDSLFSSSPPSVAFALQRISTWRSRGCLPVAVDVTASIIEIQQKDPFFRKDLGGNALQSEEMLSMLYCMAIMRLVNGIVEKTRKKAVISIAEAANAIGIPRMLIDVRHEGSHRDLPSLQLVRLASTKALDWLKSYYWEPQKNAIRRDSTANLRNEIKHKLLEMAFCLKVKQTNSLHTSGKRSKKQITRAMKAILRLYNSSSSEVASVLLELMLQTVDSSNLPGDSENALTINETIDLHGAYDDWKPILKKLSNREPDLLLTLLRAALDKIETMEATKHELGANALSGNANESLLIGQLSYLCEQIVANLKTLKPLNHNDLGADGEDDSRKFCLPEATLQELLRKCLFLSSHDNNQLMKSALVIAQMMGRNSFIHKLNKLCSLSVFDSEIIHSDPSTNSSESFLLSREEDSLGQAAQKLELIMRRVVKGNNRDTTDTGSQWVVAKTWKACPIGMLPHAFGSTGRLPILDFVDDSAEGAKSSDNEIPETHNCGCKRAIECLDDPNMKKMRKTLEPGDNQWAENMEIENDFLSDENGHNDVPLEGSKGHLMIDGVWKKVSTEELCDIAAAVKILI